MAACIVYYCTLQGPRVVIKRHVFFHVRKVLRIICPPCLDFDITIHTMRSHMLPCPLRGLDMLLVLPDFYGVLNFYVSFTQRSSAAGDALPAPSDGHWPGNDVDFTAACRLSTHNSRTRHEPLEPIRRVSELIPKFTVLEFHGHQRKYQLDRRKICNYA
jgi:hypothetical protein